MFVGDDAHALDVEEVLLPSGGAAHQQLQRGVGGFEVVALVFEALEVVDHAVDRRTVHRQAELGRLHRDRRPPGHLGHHEAGAVADRLGIDVLVGVLGAGDGAGVEAGLVGEGPGADVGRLRADRPVEQLGDVVADARQLGQPAVGEAAIAELQLEVADDRREVGVAGALADAGQRPLDVARSPGDGGHRVGHGAAGVVVAVDADRDVATDVGDDGGGRRFDLMRQRAAVGVAEHDMAGAADHGRLEDAQGELGIGLEAVEEVLHVDEDQPAGVTEEAHRVGDHRFALVERRLQRLR